MPLGEGRADLNGPAEVVKDGDNTRPPGGIGEPGDPGLSALVGYLVTGRHGPLGTVVEAEAGEEGEGDLVVRGGAHDALEFHVPASRLEPIDPGSHDVVTDVDVTDFVPRLREDGVVVLVLPGLG